MPGCSTALLLHPSEISLLLPWSISPCLALQKDTQLRKVSCLILPWVLWNDQRGKEPHATRLAVAPHPSALEKTTRVRGGTGDHGGSSSSSTHPKRVPSQRSPSLGLGRGFVSGFRFARPQMNDGELWKKKPLCLKQLPRLPFSHPFSKYKLRHIKRTSLAAGGEARNDHRHNLGLTDQEPSSSSCQLAIIF